MKKLIKIYDYHGKYSAELLAAIFCFEDTSDNRQSILEKYFGINPNGSETKKFILGEINVLQTYSKGGDMDDYIGFEFVITTYDEELTQIEKEYANRLAQLNNLFEIQTKEKENDN